nr:NAD-dependent epimerase/dehydratase family protein [Fictibacillus halophilus]
MTKGYFDETTPIVKQHQEVYVDIKSKSEQILNEYIKKGLDVIILRPGAICAEENSYWGDRQVNRMLKTDIVDWVHPEDLVPWIHADNLAEIIYLVLSKGVCNQVYNAIDGNFPEEEFRVRLVNTLGKKLRVPNRLIERPIYSNTKIKELGYQPIKTFNQTVSNLEALVVSQL